jgi:nicotinate-nucleotide pyrophosphorylase (carboxylating)
MDLTALVEHALAEDIGPGDVTTDSCVPEDAQGEGVIDAGADLVVSGQLAAAEVFRQLSARYEAVASDGAHVTPGTVIGRASGPLRSLLTGERLALNFLMHLSGIATQTSRVVQGAGALRVVDTRKTTPLLRALEKAAVVHGGGHNHRFALYDAVLIKDNHITAAGGVRAAISATRQAASGLDIQVEVETLDQLREAIDAGADAVLLDNMNNDQLAAAIAVAGGRVMVEASGNMNAERIASLQHHGLDRVSMGGLIHQARWVDLSMTLQARPTP